MILIIKLAHSLRCFESNTTVMLDVQTRQAVFKVWPRNDFSRETELCAKLKGDMYKLSIQIGTYEYALHSLQYFDASQYIDIRLACTENILGIPGTCAPAFKAKSAIYTMEFQQAKQNVTQVVSNLRRLDFDRKACFQNYKVEVGKQIMIAPGMYSDQFKFVATPINCKYPLDLPATISAGNQVDKKAVLSSFVYPNFMNTNNQYNVNTSIVLQKGGLPCIFIPIFARQVCTNMVDTLTKQSFSYLQTNYTAPGLIPNRDGTLTRVENYTTIMESNEVVNVNLQQFDCYNSQSLTIDEQSIHIKNNLKSPMVNCSKPIKDLVGDFDTMITRIIFQEYSDFRYGNVFTIDFRTDTQVLNNTNQWFTCDQSYNKSSCLSVLSMSNLSKLYLKAQQIFYKNNSPVLLLALTVNSSFSCFKNSKFSLFNDQICAEFQQNCQNSGIIGSNQFVFSFGNIGKFGNNLLNISTQGTFSETQNKYCANYNFDNNQIKQFTNVDGTQEVTGSLQIGAIQVPVSIINDNSKVQSMNGILWILVATVVATILFVGFGLLKQWV
ncbi:Conserved_hypothetical protein [Hexamita inflata]|uniref:Transmembrane protein n=1 Tax=Hexamita inflata TaxID=28002 RepID=A0AA86VJ03_9EUKA|nr:Conserved hypothetical protein [Hexamita inflata]